jgi:DNA-directed RNA polymerase subunit RPC12/RpoP
MQNDPDEIQFDCPKCKRPMSGDKALIGEMVNCPDCGEPFMPTPRKLISCAACGRQISPQAASCPGCGHPVTPAPISKAIDTRRKGTAIFSLVLGILALPWAITSIIITVSNFGSNLPRNFNWVLFSVLPSVFLHLGFLSILSFSIQSLPGIAAVIFGHFAHGRARKFSSQFAGKGVAVTGLVLGYFTTLTTVILFAFVFLQDAHAKANLRDMYITHSENNLKQIGLAFRVWAGDYSTQFPFNVSQAQGGTRELCDPDSNGFERNPVPIFMVMSNELTTPLVLYCPDDKTKEATANFASLTTNNISYQLRTGTNVNLNNPWEILAVDPIHGLVLHCDGTVTRDALYKKRP